MNGRIALRRQDPELGTMRYCRRCGEWWPEDDEFFYTYTRKTDSGRHRAGTRMTQCRACGNEACRRWHARQRGVAA